MGAKVSAEMKEALALVACGVRVTNAAKIAGVERTSIYAAMSNAKRKAILKEEKYLDSLKIVA